MSLHILPPFCSTFTCTLLSSRKYQAIPGPSDFAQAVLPPPLVNTEGREWDKALWVEVKKNNKTKKQTGVGVVGTMFPTSHIEPGASPCKYIHTLLKAITVLAAHLFNVWDSLLF